MLPADDTLPADAWEKIVSGTRIGHQPDPKDQEGSEVQ